MRVAYLFIFATLVTGFGWIAALPPWEGFDETAHYSYIQQIADTGTIPIYGASYLSRDVLAYRERFPTAYANNAPFDENGGVTYKQFFAMPSTQESLAESNTQRRFVPSGALNWQAQHPPLYYSILAPFYSVSRDWSWPTQMFMLRSVSWLFTVIGYGLGVLVTFRYFPQKNSVLAATVVSAWPFLVPMFFPEMARLGNDSLCLLITGGMWWALLRIANADAPFRGYNYAVLGLLLGLGLLTKAFFIPITVGVVLFLLFRRAWRGLAIAMGFAVLIGAPWYLYKFVVYGIATGADEYILLAQQGGLVKGLIEHFSAAALLRGLAAAVATFAWAGTWSLARLPEIFHVPLVGLLLMPLAAYGVRLLRIPLHKIDWAPALIWGMFAAGIVHHVLARIALSGEGAGTPGWYFHILAGPLGFAYALGLMQLIRYAVVRMLFPFLTLYTVGYFMAVSWLQIAMYAGCAEKLGAVKYYVFPAGTSCLGDAGSLINNLALIARPGIGVPLLFGGIVLGGAALAMLYIHLVSQKKYDSARTTHRRSNPLL